MFGKKRSDVLVVGAGPVGLYAALQLARRGVSVQVVDREHQAGTHSFALGLHPASMRLLEECDALGDVLREALHVRRIGLYDGGEKVAELNLSGLAEDYSFVAVLQQADLESHLEAALARAGVKVQWDHGVHQLRQDGDKVHVTLDKYSNDSVGYSLQHSEWVVAKTYDVDFPFVVGADGIRSTIRQRLEIGYPEVGPAVHFAVFEFETDAQLGDEMRLVFTKDTTNVCWPLPGGSCRWSFQIPPDAELLQPRRKERSYGMVGVRHHPTLDDQHLRDFLAERAPWFRGSVGTRRWQSVVRFESRCAESFGKGRVWLVGDAGHVTGPAGLQSMNVGLREARDLAAVVAAVLKGNGSTDDFADYDRARRAEWAQLLDPKRLVATASARPWVAGIANRLLPCLPAAGDDLLQLAAQIGLELRGR